MPERKRLAANQRNGASRRTAKRAALGSTPSSTAAIAAYRSRAQPLCCRGDQRRGALRGRAPAAERSAPRRARARARAAARAPRWAPGAHFERVSLEIAGEPHAAVLKVIAPDPICVDARAALLRGARGVAARRACRARSGPAPSRARPTAGCCSRSSRRRERWRPARAFDALREIARVHAATLGRAPDWLPRPFARDLEAQLAHVPDGLARLEALQAREPLVRDLATPRALALARALLRAPDALRRAFAASPECVVHRDLHSGQRLAAARGRADPVRLGSGLRGSADLRRDPAESVSRDPPAPHSAARGRGRLLRRRARRAGRSSSAPTWTRSTRRAAARRRARRSRRRRTRRSSGRRSTGWAGAPRSSSSRCRARALRLARLAARRRARPARRSPGAVRRVARDVRRLRDPRRVAPARELAES